MQQTQREIDLSSHSWNSEYNSRSSQQKEDTSVQVGVTIEMVQPYKEAMGHSAHAIDAFHQKWPKKELYLNPPWKLIPQCSEKDKRRQSQGSSVDRAVVANTILVEPTAENKTIEDANTNEAQSIIVLSRMDVIFQRRMAEGLTIENIDFLM
ncbi:hypothetical protein RMCBS344292_01845 [Rhizopus microsporus]|nr:hypothetical protein RMCBS344292_01845 [Rhizopus microsporus]